VVCATEGEWFSETKGEWMEAYLLTFKSGYFGSSFPFWARPLFDPQPLGYCFAETQLGTAFSSPKEIFLHINTLFSKGRCP